MKDLPNLDAVRTIAVLLVAFAHILVYTGHTDLAGWSGISGVCIFFVHTCLVLMWSLERDPHVGRFYIRRIFRIYPLWLVVLLLTVVVRLPISPIYAPAFRFYAAAPKELLVNALLLMNLTGGANIVGASWSLPVEVEMYILLPVLFTFALRFKAVWTFLLLDAFAVLCSRFDPGSPLLIYVPYFLPGVMAYILMKRPGLMRWPAWSFGLWLLLLLGVAHRYGNFRRDAVFCLAVGLSLPFFRQIAWKPLKAATAAIAKYSYGIYLTHMAGIVVSVHLLRTQPIALRIIAFPVVCGGLSFLFYHSVEYPMIRLGARLAGRVESGRIPRIDERTVRLEPAP